MLKQCNPGPGKVELLENRVLFNTLNVADFGAVPNDGNDDRNAIQAAIDHAKNGDSVVFDAGTYHLKSQVKLKGNITLTSASGEQDALLDSSFAVQPGNGWVKGDNFAFKGGDVSGLEVSFLKFKANSGIFNFTRADNADFRMNDFEWGYDGNYYNRLAFWISNGADGLKIEKNYFHDAEKSDRNLEIWGWANGSYSYNNFYKINDGGHIMNPGHNFLMKGNVGRLIHRMGIEIQQDRYAPSLWPKNLVIEDNIFTDWNKPYWDSMGLSVPVAGEGVTIRNNYIKQNAFNGEWGQADSSGKVRGSYGIEAPQAPSGQPGGIVEGNVIISERSVMAVSAPGKDTIVRNNKFYGPYSWSVVGGEPGSLGWGTVKESSNHHEKDASKHPKHRIEMAEYKKYKEYKEYKERKDAKDREPTAVVDDNDVDIDVEVIAPPPANETPVREEPREEPVVIDTPREEKPREENPEPSFAFLSDLEFTAPANGLGKVERDQSNGGSKANDGGHIRLNNRTFDKGIGVAGDSEVVIDLDGKYETFFSEIGIDDAVGHKGELRFEVWADGVKRFDSGTIEGTHNTESVRVDVAGVRELRLVTIGGNATGHGAHDAHYDQGNWAGARVQLTTV